MLVNRKILNGLIYTMQVLIICGGLFQISLTANLNSERLLAFSNLNFKLLVYFCMVIMGFSYAMLGCFGLYALKKKNTKKLIFFVLLLCLLLFVQVVVLIMLPYEQIKEKDKHLENMRDSFYTKYKNDGLDHIFPRCQSSRCERELPEEHVQRPAKDVRQSDTRELQHASLLTYTHPANHKKDEVFNRIKFSAFIKLAVYVAKEQLEYKLSNHAKVLPKIKKIVPYLLLDVRDRDEFLKYHIKTAKHYPAAMLSRSHSYELEEMKLHKNKRPELIILYDEDETIASRVATTLVQRGYENIYVLSGGLKVGHNSFPHSLMLTILSSKSAKLGPNEAVKFRSSSNEYFTLEDIENIQQYIEVFPAEKNIFWDGIQTLWKCCGVHGSDSYKYNLPISCCKGSIPCSKDQIQNRGCFTVLELSLDFYLNLSLQCDIFIIVISVISLFLTFTSLLTTDENEKDLDPELDLEIHHSAVIAKN